MESIITSRAYIDIPHKPILLSGCIPGQKNLERSGTGIQIGGHNYKEVHISSYDYIIIFYTYKNLNYAQIRETLNQL